MRTVTEDTKLLLDLLDTIPGVSRRVAEVLIAEIGAAMSRFSSARHLASWAGLCPGHHESAGKRKGGRTRKGSPWLRQTLIEAAHAVARSKKTYIGAQYRRIAARRGTKKAQVAVAHTILMVSLECAEVSAQALIRGRHRRRLTETAMPRQEFG